MAERHPRYRVMRRKFASAKSGGTTSPFVLYLGGGIFLLATYGEQEISGNPQILKMTQISDFPLWHLRKSVQSVDGFLKESLGFT